MVIKRKSQCRKVILPQGSVDGINRLKFNLLRYNKNSCFRTEVPKSVLLLCSHTIMSSLSGNVLCAVTQYQRQQCNQTENSEQAALQPLILVF